MRLSNEEQNIKPTAQSILMPERRFLKEILIFAGVVASGFVLIPLVMGVIGAWSGQALFSEMVRAFYTYFFHITIWASLGLYAVVMLVRLVVAGVRWLRA